VIKKMGWDEILSHELKLRRDGKAMLGRHKSKKSGGIGS
jgi:hypothetical protein